MHYLTSLSACYREQDVTVNNVDVHVNTPVSSSSSVSLGRFMASNGTSWFLHWCCVCECMWVQCIMFQHQQVWQSPSQLEPLSFTGFLVQESLQFAAGQEGKLFKLVCDESVSPLSPSTCQAMSSLLLLPFPHPVSTWHRGSRGWHIDTAARWTPACSRSDS